MFKHSKNENQPNNEQLNLGTRTEESEHENNS